MKSNETHKKWLCAAYCEFAENGPDFSLKALGIKTGLPRTTFYYHFLNKDELISELLDYHVSISIKLQHELKNIDNFVPDLYVVLYRYLTTVKFHQQLLHNCHIPTYKTLYYEANKGCIQILLPHIKSHLGFNPTDEEVFRFYNILTDAWYTRLDLKDTSPEKMISLAEEITGNILALYKGNEEYVTMDFFRFDKNGKICEHWDAIQQIPEESANPNTMY
jgi:AcrR family transcriptional regulator